MYIHCYYMVQGSSIPTRRWCYDRQ